MAKRTSVPIALTIAGSDSGGGAGIQADLKTFAALGVHGTSAITCVTAQNPKRVTGIHACPPDIVSLQIQAVFAELPPIAIKTGMLYSAQIIRAVAGLLRQRKPIPLVVDPVMVATSGAVLLRKDAIELLKRELLPRAALVTPNVHEAELLVGSRLATVEDLRLAAKLIHRSFGCAALVKGGHLARAREAADIFYDGNVELLLTAPLVRRTKLHGTGCTLSAAVTAYLAQGLSLSNAVARAKQFITDAIANQQLAAGYPTLNHKGIRSM